MRGIGNLSLVSESLKLYWVLRVLNKFWRYTRVSPLIFLNIKVVWNFCWRVIKLSSLTGLKGNWRLYHNWTWKPYFEVFEIYHLRLSRSCPKRSYNNQNGVRWTLGRFRGQCALRWTVLCILGQLYLKIFSCWVHQYDYTTRDVSQLWRLETWLL